VSEPVEGYNYLIISDLHLKESEKSPAGRLFYFDQDFTDFLRHYRHTYAGARRWRLIVGGDFIEFYHRINEQPDPQNRLLRGSELYETDLKFYPGTEWRKSVWKLDRILRSHQLLLISLARFVHEGNEIYILRGNHDLEFYWTQVQDHFRALVAEHHPAGVTYLEMKRLVQERVRFVPWFYFEPGLLYVEHGHRYDPYCSNAHNLCPVLPRQPERLEMAFSAFTMRYFVARLQYADPASMENFGSVPKYLLRIFSNNLGQLLEIPAYYWEMVVRTLGKVNKDQAPDPELEEREARTCEEVRRAYGLSPEAIRTLAGLALPPVLVSRWETLKCFLLDLQVVTVGLLAVGVGGWLWGGEPAVSWGAAAVGLGAVVWLGRRRILAFNDHRNLRALASTIREAVGCRFVVFGHSHDPDAHPLSADKASWYFNVGTWVPRGREGQFIFLEILQEGGGPVARLMRWSRAAHEPVEVDPERYAKDSAERKAAAKAGGNGAGAPPAARG
jgi:UDP-2,3-diacylglucosamine pyrophosphatase LpxH